MSERSSTQSFANWLRRPAFSLVILAVLVFLLYCGTLAYGFVWDDHAQIVDNPLIRSWHSIARVFQSDLWYHSTRNQSYYRPLFIVWEVLNYSIFALKTWGWHLSTVLLHIGASLSVYVLARKLKFEYWTAMLAAAIFGFHPVHIECTAWISAGSDSMVTIFYVLAFAAFIASRELERTNRAAWWTLSIVLAVCALFTKEMGVTLFAVVALYEYLYSTESSRARRVYKAVAAFMPYLAVTFGYLALRHFALARTITFDPSHRIRDMVATWPSVLFDYFRLLAYPVGLNGMYYTPYIKGYGWSEFFLPVIVLALVTAAVWYWVRRNHDKGIAFAALWIPLTLGTVLYLRAFPDGDFVRDRYVYLPSVGFAFLLAKLVRQLPSVARLSASAFQASVAAILCLVFMAGCVAQQGYWASDFLLYLRGYEMSPKSELAPLNLAGSLIDRQDYAGARAVLQRFFRQHPGASPNGMAMAYQYVAIIDFDSGLHREGHIALERALSYGMSSHSSRDEVQLIGLLARDGDYQTALSICSKLLSAEPDLYSALYNCGILNTETNRDLEAEKLFRHALDVSPGLAPPNYFLGQIMERRGNRLDAERFYRKAVEIDPSAGPYYALAQLLESEGRYKEAVDQYAMELRYHPLNSDAAKRMALLRARY